MDNPFRLEASQVALPRGSTHPAVWGGSAALFAIGIAILATPAMGVATLAWLMLTGGVLLEMPRRAHRFWMLAGIGLDLLLVLVLQVQRGAVQTAASFSLGPVQQLHIAFSLGAVLLYGPVVWLGWKRYQGEQARAMNHRKAGWVTYIFRTIGFVLMFSMLWRN